MLTLRPYQQQLVSGVMSAIERGDKHTLVIASTGAGKTCCMIKLSELLLEKCAEDEVVLILSHLSLLTTQTKNKFSKFSPQTAVGVLQAQKMPNPDDRVIISTMQSAKVFSKIVSYYEMSKKKVKYIFVDESHFRWSNSYKEIFDTFKDAQTIEVTATPYRGRRVATSKYDSVAFQISLQEMIDNKYLVPPFLRQMVIDNDVSEKKCALFLKTYMEYEKGNKAVFFMSSKDEAKLLCDSLIVEGVKAAVVVDSITGARRDQIFDGFEGDKYDALVTVNVLTAGWDSLVCEAIFMQGTSSPIVYMQRMGRALRPLDGDSVKPHHKKQDARCYVFGDLPTIESGAIERTHNATIKPKKFSECKTLNEQAEWLELADMQDTEEYKLCKASIKVQRLAKKIDMGTLMRLIEEKAIPTQFMTRLADGCDRFKPVAGGNKQASDQQLNALKGIGLKPPADLTSNEAIFILQSLTGKAISHHASDTYIIKNGKYAGSHVSEVPWAFKTAILKKFGNSDIAKMIRSYHKLK